MCTFLVKPPDKGSFPLDHYGECKAEMVEYMRCLKANNSDQAQCKHLSKRYFQCRMDKRLMLREDFEQLGFHQADQQPQKQSN
ncbi:hypothetical protein BOX15_Mlig024893g1 [Macrostomum lignano]|uniref:Cytochrome c oxidase assembly protein COX19 n=1 Tax=Macrostomum lignano TaxID=282301 RepID=A0A267EPN0_9PLAT|nr:hypothetical protein BOX15_Mlig024893g1 [Macrostomum lignano]